MQQPQTLDLYPDEIAFIARLLAEHIDQDNELLRFCDPLSAELVRARLEIANRLRGKLPRLA